MTRLHDQVATRSDNTIEKMQSNKNSPKHQFLYTNPQNQTGNKVKLVGVALGYLGLAFILSTAPTWQQMMSPFEADRPTCGDFGGSR